MRFFHGSRTIQTGCVVLLLSCTPVIAQAPLDFAIVQIRNNLGVVRNDAGEVPIAALRALLMGNFYANNYDGDPAISAADQLIARQLPNANTRAEKLAEFHRVDLDGDGKVTGSESQALDANDFWRENPDGSKPPPADAISSNVTLRGLMADLASSFPLDRQTLLSEDWIRVASLSVPPGFDTDRDGRVTPEEYAETLGAALFLADLDRDGLLSEGEITAIAVRATASDTLIATAPIEFLFWLE